jgi:hypothetical protein
MGRIRGIGTATIEGVGAMAEEMYFLYLDGIQRGPYTVFQIGHMVNSGIVDAEALFWCEGLEQWQPVAQLITPKQEVRRRRVRLSLTMLGVFVGLGLLGVALWPVFREVWREQHQVEKAPEAAYWRARGVMRERFGRWTPVKFVAFDPSQVRWEGPSEATVELLVQSGARPRSGSDARQESGQERWRVRVRYDDRLKMWTPSAVEPLKISNSAKSLPTPGGA